MDGECFDDVAYDGDDYANFDPSEGQCAEEGEAEFDDMVESIANPVAAQLKRAHHIARAATDAALVEDRGMAEVYGHRDAPQVLDPEELPRVRRMVTGFRALVRRREVAEIARLIAEALTVLTPDDESAESVDPASRGSEPRDNHPPPGRIIAASPRRATAPPRPSVAPLSVDGRAAAA